ncbi:hypothetical protein UAW_02186 [Enterococcus haemoperoxidus ATCC BAA-382]|uniref:ABC transporter domain-containing protein n=1 Tax=Enterococcus haemoperoxidus ATCC BAA-382 TaxID=1158608 RepID=R2QF38_9ENTE|nr:ABC transporter ATP-binding protein [Enterococcus haemoperoxidus]EOH95107.1 hypothetical protein UAW_02186 [Enterococcus haemoperoxidus ATCC BAA-382]EOT60506.1 hypothetical protein I583_03152 [Enterococcus haemoperoxidus ATCC BAA-382]
MIFEANNLSIEINKKKIVTNFNLSVKAGDFILITGKSGTGKTTLINNLSLLEKVYTGSLNYEQFENTKKNCQRIRKNVISYMFQNYGLLENMTVLENLKLAIKYNKSFKKSDLTLLLEKFSLSESILTKKVFLLSGGEQQRIALIRSLLKPFDIIFADEPTGNLDDENASFIIKYFQYLVTEKNKAVVMVTHDKQLLKYASLVIDLDLKQTQ